MADNKYKSIPQLIEVINSNANNLEKGNLNLSELNELTNDVRDLYERLVVLKYKSIEKEIKPVQETIVEKEEIIEPEAKIEEPKKSDLFGSFKFNIDTKAKNEIKPKVNPPKEEIKASGKPAGFQESIPMPEQPLPFNNPNPPKPVSEIKPEVKEEIEELIVNENQTTILDAISEEKTSINDQFTANASGENLARKLGMTPISDLKSSIAINQKFLFMNDLFAGEHDDFHLAIDKLNNFSSYNEANNYMNSELATNYNWDNDNDSVQSFRLLVERRYM